MGIYPDQTSFELHPELNHTHIALRNNVTYQGKILVPLYSDEGVQQHSSKLLE